MGSTFFSSSEACSSEVIQTGVESSLTQKPRSLSATPTISEGTSVFGKRGGHRGTKRELLRTYSDICVLSFFGFISH